MLHQLPQNATVVKVRPSTIVAVWGVIISGRTTSVKQSGTSLDNQTEYLSMKRSMIIGIVLLAFTGGIVLTLLINRDGLPENPELINPDRETEDPLEASPDSPEGPALESSLANQIDQWRRIRRAPVDHRGEQVDWECLYGASMRTTIGPNVYGQTLLSLRGDPSKKVLVDGGPDWILPKQIGIVAGPEEGYELWKDKGIAKGDIVHIFGTVPDTDNAEWIVTREGYISIELSRVENLGYGGG